MRLWDLLLLPVHANRSGTSSAIDSRWSVPGPAESVLSLGLRAEYIAAAMADAGELSGKVGLVAGGGCMA